MGWFGRKKATPAADPAPSGDDQKAAPGHQAVLAHLRERELVEPGIRERLAGAVLFDFAYQSLANEHGVQIELLLAVLASVAGQECLAAVLDSAPDDATMEQIGLTVVKGADERLYFFGDAPNRLLVESEEAVVSLAFGAAQALGAPVTFAMITDEMGKVASVIGGPDFETLDLPPEHMVDRPTEWVRVFRPRLTGALDLYDVPLLRRPAALGYALQKAIEAGKRTLDPLIAARIVLQCATRTAKVLVR